MIEQAGNTYHYTLLYHQSTNTRNQDVNAGKKLQDKFERNIVNIWILCQSGLKWNPILLKLMLGILLRLVLSVRIIQEGYSMVMKGQSAIILFY